MNTVKEICTNKKLLSLPSKTVSLKDIHNGKVTSIITDMYATIRAIDKKTRRKTLGLAAPQIEVQQRICVIRSKLGWIEMINTTITNKSEMHYRQNCEICHSYPEEPFMVRRYDKITVRYLNTKGQTKVKQFSGRTGRVTQHEIDHLEGIVPTKQQFRNGKYYKEH